ncbi:glycosyl transferase [Nitrospira sp. KM1]|uniref:glycosyltransferase n=1 Tax=Nitrospira sp. KM1 TaxID=1936990 RepID=UPI0013A740B6|nr:glycosyltransferase [Nitrospira sp. KM1]BCA55528.1 glycosyl transferase [Nitrospira sp. KM1]
MSDDHVPASNAERSTTPVPFFSIIVPTWNRPRQLRACLGALTGLEYPAARFEVIVVDDGSHPQLDATDFGRSDGRVTWLRQPNAGPAAARNTGAAKAQGEYLAFTDDDCVPAPAWLKGFARAFEHAPRAMIGGCTTNALPDNIYATASHVIVEAARAYFLSTHSQFQFFASNNLALPADLFRAMRGFDPSFRTSEDRDFCDRWVRGEHQLVYASDAVVHHCHELTLAGFWRQHFGYGRGAYRFHRARAMRGAGAFRPEFSFYRNVLGYPFVRTRDRRTASLAALFLLWQVANVAGFLWQGCRRETPR